jgi:hypothetical protein
MITDDLVSDKAIFRSWWQSGLYERAAQARLVFGPSPRKPPVNVRRDR